MINVAIMGFGTIGSGVYEYIINNNYRIKEEINDDIQVSKILDLKDFEEETIKRLVVRDYLDIVNDKNINIVVECMGGTKPTYEFVKAMILSKKHIITSNKALVAKHGTELLRLAKDNGVQFLFEASVGGGIPIIRTMTEALAGEYINEIEGILNGTTNFILTRMQEDGDDFIEALKMAQDLGYAERNPEADIEGFDTCRKIAILASLASKKELDFEQIYTEGISNIDKMDFKYAQKLKYGLKLIGVAKFLDNALITYVCPMLVDKKDSLYSVSDVFNAIVLKGNMLGPCMLYGSGAGKLPTASAIIADLISIAKNNFKNQKLAWTDEKLNVVDFKETEHKYFVRFKIDNNENIKAYKKLFNTDEIYILNNKPEAAIITSYIKEKDFLDKIKSLPSLIKFIRVKK